MPITSLAEASANLIPPITHTIPALTGLSNAALRNQYYIDNQSRPAFINSPGISGQNATGPAAGSVPIGFRAGTETVLSLVSGSVNTSTVMTMLVDRLWTASGFSATSTTEQAINSSPFPARDINGTSNGEGVYLCLLIAGATGAGTPNLSVRYTSSQGVANRVAGHLQVTSASSPAERAWIFSLQAGDTGVRSVQGLTLSATWTSGTIHLFAFRPILMLPAVSAFASAGHAVNRFQNDIISLCAPRIFPGSYLHFLDLPGGTAGGRTLTMTFSQG